MTLKIAWKLNTREKINSPAGMRCTTDHGLHHGSTVVSAGSTFFYSSFFPWAWQLGDICGESKCTQLGSKQGSKGPESCKTQKRTIPESKMGKGA